MILLLALKMAFPGLGDVVSVTGQGTFTPRTGFWPEFVPFSQQNRHWINIPEGKPLCSDLGIEYPVAEEIIQFINGESAP